MTQTRSKSNKTYRVIKSKEIQITRRKWLEIAVKEVKSRNETTTAVFLTEFEYDRQQRGRKNYGHYKNGKFIPYRQVVLPDDEEILQKFIETVQEIVS